MLIIKNRRMKKIAYSIILFLVFVSLNGKTQTEKWSLTKCLNYAYENNIQIKQNTLNNEINRLEINRLKANRIPSLNAGDNQSFNWNKNSDDNFYNTNTFSINSSIVLFNGFQNNNSLKQSELNYKAGEYAIEETKNSISLSIANSYLEILFYTDQVKIAKNQLESTQEQLQNTKNRVDAGILPISNYLQLEAQQYSEELTLTNTENQLRISKLNLMQMMEIPVSDKFEIEIPDKLQLSDYSNMNQSIELIYETALNVRPEIQSSLLNSKSAEYDIKIAKGSQLPKLTLNAGIGTQYSSLASQMSYGAIESTTIGYLQSNPSELVLSNQPSVYYNDYPFFDQYNDNLYESVSLNLSIPIFNQYQAKTSIEKSKINLKYAKLDLINTQNTLRKNIEQSFTDLLAAQKEYEANQKLLIAYEKTYSDASKKFNAGMINSIDFLIEKTNLINAENNLLQSKYKLVFKNMILDHYQGKPITF